ncbi:MAG: gliding motility-associated C-terminal domain-containing protein [Sphingobacteriales bacterium]|nr:MAG: gliding motility-associated C-terminal domain-containing protein [Sphingobacteriales bacterium]
MKNNQFSIILLLLLAISLQGQGQNQNKNWHFGKGISINFNVLPLTVVQSNIDVIEGAAAVSDDNGHLLFYTMGCKIWNRNGVQMPNATGLLGNGPFNGSVSGSGYRSVQIIKHPGNPNQYYVVSGDAYEQATRNLQYSLVDMSLDNGLGDVVPGQKNIQIMTNCSEYLSVFRGNDCNSYWLIARAENPQSGRPIYAFKVDQNGFNNTPVVTYPSNLLGSAGYDELYLLNDLETAVGINFGNVISIKFDGNTGIFSNFQHVPNYIPGVGEFNGNFTLSLDRTKMYIVESYSSDVYQYDLNQIANPTAFLNSRTLAISGYGVSDRFTSMRAGTDGHLYLIRRNASNALTSRITRMTNANGPVSNTTYDNNFLEYFHPWGTSYLGYFCLGVDVESHPPADTVIHNAKDTMLCFNESVVLQSSINNASGYRWSDGSTQSSLPVDEPGTYWVSSFYNCRTTIDTFIVRNTSFTLQLTADTLICEGRSVTLDAYHPAIETYTWNTGAATASISAGEPGTYFVTATSGRCILADTFELSTQKAVLELSQGDTTICNTNSIEITAQCNLPSTYLWSDGTQGPTIKPSASGTYAVTASNVCGAISKSVTINVEDCYCELWLPTAFSPNGDGLNDVFVPKIAPGCSFSNYKFKVYNRYGQLIFSTNQAGLGWDGFHLNRAAEAGIYYYIVTYSNRYSGESKLHKGDLSLIR